MQSAFGVDHGEISKNAKSEILRLGMKTPDGVGTPSAKYFVHNRAHALSLGARAGKAGARGSRNPAQTSQAYLGRANKTAANFSLNVANGTKSTRSLA